MRSTLLRLERRANRAATLALLGTALFAACDDSRPLEPSGSSLPSSPAFVRTGNTGAVAWHVVTGANATLLGGSTFQLWNSKTTYVVTDNDNSDTDGVVGQITLTPVVPGLYSLCEINPPAGYTIPPSAKCKPAANRPSVMYRSSRTIR